MASSITTARWRLRFGKGQSQGADAAARQGERTEGAKSLLIGRHHYVFGLDWRLYTRQSDLSRTMRSLQRQGYTHYLKAARDMAGFAAGLDRQIRQTPHSAALQLAETVSQGGVEMFVFRITDRLFSLTVLSESKPIPHFDQVGTLDEVLSLIQEYQSLQSGQAIRYVSNIDGIDGIDNLETLSLTEAFGTPEPEAALKGLLNYRLLMQLGLVLVPAVLVFLGGGYWLYSQQQDAQRRRLAQMQDPNLVYEQQVDGAVRQIGPSANAVLERWRATIGQLPVSHAGWRLEKISCQINTCTASWLRESGSFNDFKSHPPVGVSDIAQSQTGEDPTQARIETTLTVPAIEGSAQWRRADLPTSEQATLALTSQLQDMALLQEAQVKLKPPELFPSTGAAIAQLSRPVVRGEWSLSHELWSLGDLRLDFPAQVLQSLNIQSDDKTKNWVYTLTGHYYGKGKNY